MTHVLEPKVRGRFDVDTGETRLRYEQPINPIKRHTKEARDKAEHFGLKPDALTRVASIPPVIALKILEDHNINLMTCGHEDRMRALKIIQRDYPQLMTVPGKVV